MAFLTLTADLLTCDNAATGYAIYFSPSPPTATLPTVWLDLHATGDYYQECENERRLKFKPADASGRRYIRIGPQKGIRLITAEQVGLDCLHIGVVVNVASRAKHGLIVAPGKIDPGFNPHPLVLVVYNQSERTILLHEGDKIACVAFAELSEPARASLSKGHADGDYPDFEQALFQRFVKWFTARNYDRMFYGFLVPLLSALLGAFLGVWFAKHLK